MFASSVRSRDGQGLERVVEGLVQLWRVRRVALLPESLPHVVVARLARLLPLLAQTLHLHHLAVLWIVPIHGEERLREAIHSLGLVERVELAVIEHRRSLIEQPQRSALSVVDVGGGNRPVPHHLRHQPDLRTSIVQRLQNLNLPCRRVAMLPDVAVKASHFQRAQRQPFGLEEVHREHVRLRRVDGASRKLVPRNILDRTDVDVVSHRDPGLKTAVDVTHSEGDGAVVRAALRSHVSNGAIPRDVDEVAEESLHLRLV
mmetsp:Transcript_4138/g.7948  ORF Transcript_4138/g.7948 Transcript_4138/m.7948 type:complete len:259 (-) Transcript_4138:73-849(-)